MNYYKQITFKERSIIERLLNIQSKSISFIAKELKRSRSTIYRELAKNKAKVIYTAKDSQFTRDINNFKSHSNQVNKYKDFLEFLYAKFDKKVAGSMFAYLKLSNYE